MAKYEHQGMNSERFYNGHFFYWRDTMSLTDWHFSECFLFIRDEILDENLGILLLLGRRGGKTGTNMRNWRDVFEYYFKKILSIFFVFNTHYLSL